jgi:hypothetical protein
MKTIKISMHDETYRLYQTNAEAAGISVEDWVSARLTGVTLKRASPDEFERLCKLQQEILERIRTESPGFSAADRLPREDLYDRDAFR